MYGSCRVGDAGGLEVLVDTVVPDRPPSLFAGSPLLLMGRYRGQPHGPVEVRGKTPTGPGWREESFPERPGQSGDRLGMGARPGAPARGPLCRRAPAITRPSSKPSSRPRCGSASCVGSLLMWRSIARRSSTRAVRCTRSRSPLRCRRDGRRLALWTPTASRGMLP